ncbi:MAG TPA: hypothetical protein VG939_10225 [Caulobacteraceae bacterium]|nr:hypothetical protein [Caulobacteraceae bacterium]
MRSAHLLLTLAALGPSAATAEPPAAAVTAADAARSASATVGPFAIGTPVRDSRGAPLGHITRMQTDKTGRDVVLVRRGSDSFTIPAQELRMVGGVAVTTRAEDQLDADRSGRPR